ncbi:MAG: alpha/beta hydrolase [Thermoleophilaceae bacterium]
MSAGAETAPRLDPQAERVLAEMQRWYTPPLECLTVERARRLQLRERRLALAAERVGGVSDERAAIGGRTIGFRLYEPVERLVPGALVFAHGGGWVLGSVELADPLCRALANSAGCAVASVEYRLAPEHPFPAALEDVYGALAWFAARAHRYGVDPDRLAVGGDSAGGNLAAAAALLACERGQPPLRLQLLIYPALDPACGLESHRLYGEGFGLTHTELHWLWRQYLPRPAARQDPHAAPLHARPPRDLAPALVAVAECDVVRSDGEAYAELLRAAGVPVRTLHYDGQIHAFLSYGGWIERAREAVAEIGAATRAALA